MIRYFPIVITVCITLLISGCIFKQKTWLSDEVKRINPYKIGQELTFISNKGVENHIKIIRVHGGAFAEGIGAPNNERFKVLAFHNSNSIQGGKEATIFYLYAKTDKEEAGMFFSFSMKDAYQRIRSVTVSDFNNRPIIQLDNGYQSLDDVIHFKRNIIGYINSPKIVEFYWSKSKGYVRLIQGNGVVWDLKSIEN